MFCVKIAAEEDEFGTSDTTPPAGTADGNDGIKWEWRELTQSSRQALTAEAGDRVVVSYELIPQKHCCSHSLPRVTAFVLPRGRVIQS